MKRTLKALAVAAITIAAFLAGAVTANAQPGDPTVTATCDTTVAVGTPLHCTVTIDQPGYTPANPRITWRNPRTGATLNVANYTVIPVTYDGTAWQYTYTPTAGETGRVETFSVTVAVSAARIPRTVIGYAGFSVVAP